MILNILMIVLLYLFTLYGIIVGNIVYMMPGEFLKDPLNPIFIVLIYGILILWTYLLYVLIHGVYKKKIHKNYGYSYLAFFPIFIIFYFGYYIQYDRGDFIPESTFETKLQNIEVKKEDNGLIQMGKIYTNNDLYKTRISNLDEKIRNNYYCITGDKGKKCEEENLKETLLEYKKENEIVAKINKEISELVKHKYFKQEINGEHVSLQGLSAVSRISLFSIIYELEEGNEDKAIKILLDYKIFGDKMLEGDNSLVGIIVGASISYKINNNTNYILNNYDIKSENLNLLKNDFINKYNADDIFANAIKIEYWSNKYGIEEGFSSGGINTNMLLNKEEYYNERRKYSLSIINNGGYYYDTIPKNYFKRTFIYRLIGYINNFSSQGYREDIEAINTEREKIVEKIELKLGG